MATKSDETAERRLLNVNVGVLGHVDSGKTSLVAALSTTLSTAALDKSPQSKSRGITLDLGLSAFRLPMPDALRAGASEAGCDSEVVNCTLVDCPGHASLIKTIIGGASIIDMAILVVDIVKGFQAQTAECLVIAGICCRDLVVVLNKVDVLSPDAREATVRTATQKVHKALEKTRFAGARVVAVAAAPSGVRCGPLEAKSEGAVAHADDAGEHQTNAEESRVEAFGINDLLEALGETMHLPRRQIHLPLVYAIDHCFSLRGRGTILAGTVLQGTVAPGDEIEVVHLRQSGRVRSLEIFKKSVQIAYQGDRVALNVPGFDSKQIERGIGCAPGTVPHLRAAVVLLRKVRFHRRELDSGRKLHVTIGHLTMMATCYYFGAVELALQGADLEPAEGGNLPVDGSGLSGAAALDIPSDVSYDWEMPFEYSSTLLDGREVRSQVSEAARTRDLEVEETTTRKRQPLHWAFLQFDSAIPCPMRSLFIASRLDLEGDTGGNDSCRIATYGRVVAGVGTPGSESNGRDLSRNSGGPRLPRLYKWKLRRGEVARVTSGGTKNGSLYEPVTEYLVSGMFANGAAVVGFLNCIVVTGRGVLGRLVAAYGTAGEARVRPLGFSPGCTPPAAHEGAQVYEGDAVYLRFKKFVKVGGKLPHAPPPRELFQGTSPVVFQDEDSKLLPVELRMSEFPAEMEQIPAEDSSARDVRPFRAEGNDADDSGAAPPQPEMQQEKTDSSDSSGGAVANYTRTGTISKFTGSTEGEYIVAIIQGAFTPAEDIRAFVGSPVLLKKHQENYSKDLEGALEGPFAKSGKCKVRFPAISAAQLGDEVDIQLIDEEHN